MRNATGVTVQKDGAVAVIELNNPPLNLLNMEIRAELMTAAHRIGADPSIRAVVLCSAGERSFSAGSDISEFPDTFASGVARTKAEHEAYDALADLPQPLIVALQGSVLGGGFELALTGDLRVSEDTAHFGLPEVKLGVFPSGGGTQRLPRLIGASRAKRLMFLGEALDAEKALDLGVVDILSPRHGARPRTLELAREIAAQPRRAVQAIKHAVDHGLEHGKRAGLVMEAQRAADIFPSHDAREGVSAFLAKRSPSFDHS